VTGRYKGILVRVARIKGTRAWIVWDGMLKRVNKADLELLTDAALIAGLILSIGLFAWLIWH
jgi:hypothetical protein